MRSRKKKKKKDPVGKRPRDENTRDEVPRGKHLIGRRPNGEKVWEKKRCQNT